MQVGAEAVSPCKSDTPDAPEPLTPRKKRVLPAWMMAVAPAALNTSPAKGIRERTSCSLQRQLGSLSGLFPSADGLVNGHLLFVADVRVAYWPRLRERCQVWEKGGG